MRYPSGQVELAVDYIDLAFSTKTKTEGKDLKSQGMQMARVAS